MIKFRPVAFIILGLALATATEARRSNSPLVYYEGQPISEVQTQSSSQLLQYSESVVGFVLEKDVVDRNGQIFLNKIKVHEENRICPGQQDLLNAYSSFYCSGVFVGPHHVLTAGHCVEDIFCREFSMVRNGQKNRIQGALHPDDFFTCKRFYKVAGEDLAIVETYEEYRGLPAKHDPQIRLQPESPIFLVGHPLGMPLHLAKGKVRSIESGHIVAEISAFKGNSGGPVYSQETGYLVGILVQGANDFNRDPVRGCQTINRCKAGECKGEKISLIPAEVIPQALSKADSQAPSRPRPRGPRR